MAALAVIPMLLNSAAPQASVIDSGSTNRAGVTVSFDESGNATVEQHSAEPQTIRLNPQLCQQLMRDIKSAGALNALPGKHCAKSASFGSSLFVEANGDRSPDLSCPGQEDARTAALQKDAQEVLAAVRKQLSGTMRVRPVRPI